MNELAYKFWKGQIDLWKSYWLVGELLNAVFLFTIFNIEIYFFKNNYLIKTLPFFDLSSFNILTKLALTAWTIYITVGVWRSAENYKGNIIWIILTFLFLSYRIFTFRLIFFS